MKAAKPIGKKKRILITDDDQHIRRLASICLKEMLGEEYELLEAADGTEAIKLAIEKQPVLILMDVVMPGMDGIEACRQLKGNDATDKIPIIFLTGQGEEDFIEQGIDSGGDAYIVKPFHAITLTAQVRELLSRTQASAG